MTNETPRQEVTVTDVRMPFWSMVVFMVKWAVAAIPALIILVVLTALFWSGVLGFFVSLGSLARQSTAASTPERIGKSAAPSQTSEETAYLDRVAVRSVKVGKTVLSEDGIWGEIKNTGDRTLKEVEITVYGLGKDGKPVFEASYSPVLVSRISVEDNSPLKPGYSRQFGYKLTNVVSDWTRKVDVKISAVHFQ